MVLISGRECLLDGRGDINCVSFYVCIRFFIWLRYGHATEIEILGLFFLTGWVGLNSELQNLVFADVFLIGAR